MKLENQNILIISNEPWGDVWYSKHNYANELAKKNQVFFVNPTKKWKFSNLFLKKINVSEIKSNLHLLEYKNVLPCSGLINFIYRINNLWISKIINRYLSKSNIFNIIFWSFDPYRLSNPKLLNAQFSIFFYADPYYSKQLAEINRNVDFIITITESFYKFFESANKPYLVINHSISHDNFFLNSECSVPKSYLQKGYLLYIGAIDDRMDFEVIRSWLEMFPNEDFLFIGNLDLKKISNLGKEIILKKKYSNIEFISAIPFMALRDFIYYSKVALLPRIPTWNVKHNSQKILQYLAMGKPVVCPIFSDFQDKKNILFSYNDKSNCVEILNRAINDSGNNLLARERVLYAENYTFEKQLKTIENFIKKNAHSIHSCQ